MSQEFEALGATRPSQVPGLVREIRDEARIAVLRELLADADTDVITAAADQDGHYGQLEVTVARRLRGWLARQLAVLVPDDDVPSIPRLPQDGRGRG